MTFLGQVVTSELQKRALQTLNSENRRKSSVCFLKGGGKMFSGMTNNTIDSKGRIILPAKFREELGESFYITSGFEDCLQVFSNEQFENYSEQIKRMPGDVAASMQYILIAPATQVTPNAQGRISIPQALREQAQLDKNVVVLGLDTRIEIWNSDKFREFFQKQKKEVAKPNLNYIRL